VPAITERVDLPMSDGRIVRSSNPLGIEGSTYGYADDTSKLSLMKTLEGARACIRGDAARVDLACTPVAPATDCYGTFWGAAIGQNLNQSIDTGTQEIGTPMAFDAASIRGFSFSVEGSVIPASLRFGLVGTDEELVEYCSSTPLRAGLNTVYLGAIRRQCWSPECTPSAETIKTRLQKLTWTVVTNENSTTPYNFCITDLKALQ
jgi:hypothetical protein